ncbi:MAG: hypothetical protein EOQ34_12795 [Mesorhizobium sp.]|nr:MAG: hypothetical protein EOQ34_12795 [Mesorhizobium sp.]
MGFPRATAGHSRLRSDCRRALGIRGSRRSRCKGLGHCPRRDGPLEELATNGARASSELAAEGAVARQAVETKSLVKAADDVAVSQAPTGQFYSVVFETKLDRALYPGASRPRHFQAANEALLVLMEREPDFAKVLQEGGITLQRTKRGLAPRTAPPGYTWHHAEEPGVMQLVPRYQHDFGTIFQKTLHPNRRGGFSLWGK